MQSGSAFLRGLEPFQLDPQKDVPDVVVCCVLFAKYQMAKITHIPLEMGALINGVRGS